MYGICFHIVLLGLLQACSGSQFGKKLTNSFDEPLGEFATSNNVQDKNIRKKPKPELKSVIDYEVVSVKRTKYYVFLISLDS